MIDRPIHVRIVSPITARNFRPPAVLEALGGLGLKVSGSQIEEGPASIESEFETAICAPDTIRRIVEAEREGVDAVVIDCMADPALRAAREMVRIPVIGPSQAAMHVAAMLGHRFSVVTVMRRLRAQFENAAALHGLASRMASVRSVDIPVLALEDDLDATQRLLVEQARLAVEKDGAEAVIFGCTGLLGCAGAVRAGLLAGGIDIPVIDPIPNAVHIAAALARSNLTHSALTYPPPPEKDVAGFEALRASLAAAAQ
ncbi:hydrogenase expression protein HupH [Aureimonas ureilytica]|uniref:Hydrogenase expression protein HupH n=1 Tax=Aureimonas ureilytica TaxID=401562 RepID=A0A175R8N1_9HYPH|nr:aspartate/glutamate racemase family protein [Aureimonas ureilytica]KTQ95630.1 hydrogenase expression protein HupH [Aureimonas ureilytica]KTR08209.1 hydrogenase expression protein HupH [Aureimonas ureilytica]